MRIDDIDPPREIPGATDAILRDLERLELYWDGPVLYQSARFAAYAAVVDALLAGGKAYRCRCSRRQLRSSPDGSAAPYPGTCRKLRLGATEAGAVRVCVDRRSVRFDDRVQGIQESMPAANFGDFVIFRREGLPAYHLATVLDDALLGVSDVVRGVDLLGVTSAHAYLHALLGLPTPHYAHVPVIVSTTTAQKLSKQTGAGALDTGDPSALAVRVLEQLGLTVPRPAQGAPPHELWRWASARWTVETLAHRLSLPEG